MPSAKGTFEVQEENFWDTKRDFKGEKDYGDTFLTQYAKNKRAEIGAKLYEYDNGSANGGKSAWVNQQRTQYGDTPWTDDGWKSWRSSLKAGVVAAPVAPAVVSAELSEFDAIDTDHDGVITKEEWEKAHPTGIK